jgi:hypothetical protein
MYFQFHFLSLLLLIEITHLQYLIHPINDIPILPRYVYVGKEVFPCATLQVYLVILILNQLVDHL